jgi:UDP-N-acetylglucosamine pyrophosphorylase
MQKTEERCQVTAVAVARFEIEKKKIFTVSQNSYPRWISSRLQVVNNLSFLDLLL